MRPGELGGRAGRAAGTREEYERRRIESGLCAVLVLVEQRPPSSALADMFLVSAKWGGGRENNLPRRRSQAHAIKRAMLTRRTVLKAYAVGVVEFMVVWCCEVVLYH